MKAEVTKEITVNLTLTGNEAKILADLVQNSTCDPSEEPVEVATLRKELWDTIKAALRR